MKRMENELDLYSNKSILAYYFKKFTSVDYAFYTNEQRMNLLANLDKSLSEELEMPLADFNLDFNSMNNSVKEMFPYAKETYGIGTLLLYLFNKREQYQRICVESNDTSYYDEKDLKTFELTYNHVGPFSGEKCFIDRKYGLNLYLLNTAKADAFMYSNYIILDLYHQYYDKEEVKNSNRDNASILKYILQTYSIIERALNLSDRIDFVEENEFTMQAAVAILEKKYLQIDKENDVLANLKCYLVSNKEASNEILMFFDESIWKNLDGEDKQKAVKGFCDVLSKLLTIDDLNVCYDKFSVENFDFDSNDIYADDYMSKKGYTIMQILLYQACFKKYAKYFKESNLVSDEELQEYKEKFINKDYSYLKNCKYFNDVNKMAVICQKRFNSFIKTYKKMYRFMGVSLGNNKDNKIYDLKKNLSKRR